MISKTTTTTTTTTMQAALGKARLDQYKAMRARDESKKNAVMNFLEAQQSEYGQGKKKRHKK